MIWLLTAISLAGPLMTPITEGEVAPFSGRLFNDEAVVSIITMKVAIAIKLAMVVTIIVVMTLLG